MKSLTNVFIAKEDKSDTYSFPLHDTNHHHHHDHDCHHADAAPVQEGGDPERLDITFGGTALHAAVDSNQDEQVGVVKRQKGKTSSLLKDI